MMHRIFFRRMTALFLCALIGFSTLSLGGCLLKKDTVLSVDILKIGKADCIIINHEGKTVMIDTGEVDDGYEIINECKALGVDRLDYLIITHFDKDHIGGSAAVLNAFAVGELIEPDYETETPDAEEYIAYCNALQEKGITPTKTKKDFTFQLGNAAYQIFTAGKHTYDKNMDNNYSLMVSLVHDGNSFLFAGDVEKQRIDDILKEGIDHYDFLKVPHHGVYNKSSTSFLQAISPKYAVITCSAKNQADDALLTALSELDCEVWCTKDNEVRVISSQEGIQINPSGT